MKPAKGSVMSDVSAEVEGPLAVAVTDVPNLPHHAEIPTDAHHPHLADVLEKMIISGVQALDAANFPLPAAAVLDV